MSTIEYVVSSSTANGIVEEKFLGPRDRGEAVRLVDFLKRSNRLLAGEMVDLHPAGELSLAERLTSLAGNKQFHLAIVRTAAGDDDAEISARDSTWGRRLKIVVTVAGKIRSQVTAGSLGEMADPPNYVSVNHNAWLNEAVVNAIRPAAGDTRMATVKKAWFLGEFNRSTGPTDGEFIVIVDEFMREQSFHGIVEDLKRLTLSSPSVLGALRNGSSDGSLPSDFACSVAKELLKRPRPAKEIIPPLPGEPGYAFQ
jgi:hypothetical protein